jgi:hypothetical protein
VYKLTLVWQPLMDDVSELAAVKLEAQLLPRGEKL